jgi:hypothetical protein
MAQPRVVRRTGQEPQLRAASTDAHGAAVGEIIAPLMLVAPVFGAELATKWLLSVAAVPTLLTTMSLLASELHAGSATGSAGGYRHGAPLLDLR